MKFSAILSTVSFSPVWLLQLPQPHRASAALSKLSTVIFDCNRPFDVSSMFCRRGCYRGLQINRLELCAPVFCLIILFRTGSFTGALGISLASFMKLTLRGKCRLWCMLYSHVILTHCLPQLRGRLHRRLRCTRCWCRRAVYRHRCSGCSGGRLDF